MLYRGFRKYCGPSSAPFPGGSLTGQPFAAALIFMINYFIKIIKRSRIILAVKTDEGLTGWGEITGSTDDIAAAQLAAVLSEDLQGRDPLNLFECMAPYYQWQYPVIKTNRIVSCVWSGIDQALWDRAAREKISGLTDENRESQRRRQSFVAVAEREFRNNAAGVKSMPLSILATLKLGRLQ
jgi:hypothetical protein